ncbi:MAG: YIP1 family protein [Halomonas sp.]|nr:YIP1 family protein [Halomonas sp.]
MKALQVMAGVFGLIMGAIYYADTPYTKWTKGKNQDLITPFLFDTTFYYFFVVALIFGALTYLAVLGAKAYDYTLDQPDSGNRAALITSYVFVLAYVGCVISAMASRSYLDNAGSLGQIALSILLLPVMIGGGIFGVLASLLIPFVLPAFIAFAIPLAAFGLYSLLVTGETEESRIVLEHTQKKEPISNIEARLARAVESGMASDEELREILESLPPMNRFFHSFKYKRQAEKYRSMRRFMDAQRNAADEREEFAYSAHEFERSKRRAARATAEPSASYSAEPTKNPKKKRSNEEPPKSLKGIEAVKKAVENERNRTKRKH